MTKSADLPLVTLHSAFPIGIGCRDPLRCRDLHLNNPSDRWLRLGQSEQLAPAPKVGDNEPTRLLLTMEAVEPGDVRCAIELLLPPTTLYVPWVS
jgi:hypothetical protein